MGADTGLRPGVFDLLRGGVDRAELTEAGVVAVYDDHAGLRAGLARSPIGDLRARTGQQRGTPGM